MLDKNCVKILKYLKSKSNKSDIAKNISEFLNVDENIIYIILEQLMVDGYISHDDGIHWTLTYKGTKYSRFWKIANIIIRIIELIIIVLTFIFTVVEYIN